MKNYWFILLLFLGHFVVAQNTSPTLLIPYRVGDKWGYSNPEGEIVIATKYQEANPFYYAKALVKRKGKFGFVDGNGKVIISIKYSQATNFSKDFDGNAKVTYKGKTYFINHFGKPTTFRLYGKQCGDNNLIICGETENAKPYFIYHFPTNIDLKKWDTITLNFLNFRYPDINCILLAKKETGWGAISKENHNLIPFENDTLIVQQYDYYKFKKNGLWGLYSKSGKLLIENKYTSLQVLDNSLILVTLPNGKKGYLSLTGKEYFSELY